jgi:excisionase family DNA binding protein
MTRNHVIMGVMVKRLTTATTDDFLTTQEAAEYLNVKPEVIRNYLWEGKLTKYKFKNLTLLSIEELTDWKEYRSTG